MKAYILYKDKSVKGFKKLINSGGSIFDKYRTIAVQFIHYASGDLDKKLKEYDTELDLNSINLESVFPANYKWLVSNVAMKDAREYLLSLEKRITEFEGKEDNLKMLVGILFVRFVLITKIIDTYLQMAVSLKRNGKDVSNLDLSDIGIGKPVLKYFDNFKDLGSKTIDEWLAVNIDPTTSKYFYSSMKRILKILTGNDI